MTEWYTLHLNPEPWEVPPLSIGRKSGKIFPFAGRNEKLYAFQQAVKEELEMHEPVKNEGDVSLTFFFWRQASIKAVADATNMQKALEDALQGLLFDNDRQVRDVRSVIADQSPEREDSCIVIRVRPFNITESMSEYVNGLKDWL